MKWLLLWTVLPLLVAGGSAETLAEDDAARQVDRGNLAEGTAPAQETTAIDDPLFIGPASRTASEQALVERTSRENSLCRGGPGNRQSTLDACERRQKLMPQLEKSGLCWGRATIEADMHWIRCSADPAFTPGQFDKPYYTEKERRDLLGDRLGNDSPSRARPPCARDRRDPG